MKVLSNIDLDSTSRVVNSLDPILSQDLVTLGYADSTYIAIGSRKVTQEVDFGAVGDYLSITVPATWVDATTSIVLSILPNLTDHDTEDVLLEELKCTYGNIVNGVSFDLHIHAPNETWGRYIVKAMGF